MRKQTDLAKVKQTARSLLFTDIHETEFSPVIVSHPFTDSGFVASPNADGEIGLLNITESDADQRRWREYMGKLIDGAKSAYEIYMMITKPYDLVADGIRTKKEINAPGYSAENSFTELYRSGRIQIGYKLTWCKLSPLPNGEDLKVGKYNMVMMIDAYDPVTNEKSLVNARALTTVQILDQ